MALGHVHCVLSLSIPAVQPDMWVTVFISVKSTRRQAYSHIWSGAEVCFREMRLVQGAGGDRGGSRNETGWWFGASVLGWGIFTNPGAVAGVEGV